MIRLLLTEILHFLKFVLGMVQPITKTFHANCGSSLMDQSNCGQFVRMMDYVITVHATKEQKMKKGAFGVDLNDDNSPLYVVQDIDGLFLLCSTRFDDPPCCWVTIKKDDFWPLA